jgi:O-antigen ligase
MNKINIALTAFILFVLILTGKRAHCVFALVCLFAAYYVYNSDKPKNRLMKTLALIAVGGIALVLIVEIAPDAVPVIRRFIYMSQLEDSSLGRNARMLLALNLFLRNALTGIGWNGFTYYYNATFGDWLNVHNVYLQLLCEEGLLFSLAFFAFFIVSFLHAWNALKQSRVQKLDGINESLLLYSVYIQAFFLLYSLTGNPLYDAPFLFPYIFGCAFGEYYYRKVKELTAYES